MDWQKGEDSQNVEEDGGGRGGFNGRHLGLGGILVLLVLSLIFRRDLVTPFLSSDAGVPATAAPSSVQAVNCAQPATANIDFVCHVLGSTEHTWRDIFAAHGWTYVDPKLELFTGAVVTACGYASAAVGPFYCPADRKVYLDLDFFQALQDRFHAAGDFARAYVIAHEVGHHVQNLTGTFERVEQARRRGVPMDGPDGLSVRQELQADCYAGVWANRSEQRLHWLQPGDVESALNAASQIGDDTLQQATQGRVVPDTFTHGTSAQRVKWFEAGLTSGDMASCDTFGSDL